MNNSDKPAMPIQLDYLPDNGTRTVELWRGLSKREHFAAMAMQGMLSNSSLYGETVAEEIARQSILMADALLQELSK
jgi:hypothetical protein